MQRQRGNQYSQVSSALNINKIIHHLKIQNITLLINWRNYLTLWVLYWSNVLTTKSEAVSSRPNYNEHWYYGLKEAARYSAGHITKYIYPIA